MTDDLALFGEEPPEAAPVEQPAMIADWQRDLIRRALDARGLASMDDRQKAVEQAAGREVQSLRELRHEEALLVLNQLSQSSPVNGRSESLWESRDEDTWIDRL